MLASIPYQDEALFKKEQQIVLDYGKKNSTKILCSELAKHTQR